MLSQNEIERLSQCTANLKHQSELSDLALTNRKLFARLLPKSAWSSLSRCIETQQGYRAGAISVLHTWNQKLENHWHVHLLVPGAGPSVRRNTRPSTGGCRWVKAEPPAGHDNSDGFYLVDADALRAKFRSGFLRRLDNARAASGLQLTGRFDYLNDDDNWKVFKKQLRQQTWVAHIQPPPTSESLAHHVVNYLTRYVTGGPISDHRIVSANVHSVTFMAREGNRVGGERKQVPTTLSTAEFTERWTQLIQPASLTKVRYFGGWSNSKVAEYTQQCKALSPISPSTIMPCEPTHQSAPWSDVLCDHCGSDRLVLQESTGKPSWRNLLGYQSESVPWV